MNTKTWHGFIGDLPMTWEPISDWELRNLVEFNREKGRYVEVRNEAGHVVAYYDPEDIET